MNWVITHSGNGLLPVQRQAIPWTDADILSIETAWEQTSLKF